MLSLVAHGADWMARPGTIKLNLYKNYLYEKRDNNNVLVNYVNITNYGTNISSNPLMNTGVPWRIQTSSPCRDAANPTYAPEDDIEGRPHNYTPNIGYCQYL
jgi:hypothetical protein